VAVGQGLAIWPHENHVPVLSHAFFQAHPERQPIRPMGECRRLCALSGGSWEMYESHFGLRSRPFRAIADPEGYYPATTHEAAIAQLLQSVQDDEGLMFLTGEPGSGKTILCQNLLDRFPENTVSVFLTHSHFGGLAGLLQAILYDLGLPHENKTEQELRLTLTGYVLRNYEAGRRTVVIVDEAQNLPIELLEELRLFTNLEGKAGRAFQSILAGQPRLLETLIRPEAVVIDQRSSVRLQVERLGPDEAADYLFHQVRQAGGRPEEIFADEAVEMLAGETGGNPRRLNRAADLGLKLAHAAGGEQLDVEAAMEALARLSGNKEDGPADEEEVQVEESLTAAEAECDRPLLVLDNETPEKSPNKESPRFLAPKRPA
jgi:type II secretory pathway predicted ATPase ExeA